MSDTDTKPRYIQISDEIRAQIQSGEWDNGDRLPSFEKMYREHGASTSTMQKAYERLEKEGFVERRAHSGVYVTNNPPVQAGVLAYVIPEIDDTKNYASTSYSLRLLHGAHQEAATRGYQLALCTITQLQTNDFPFSGCIVQGNGEQIRICAALGKPVVSLISYIPEIPTVRTDDVAGFQNITDHLISLGHHRIAILISKADAPDEYPERLKGYCEALTKNTIQPDEAWQRRLPTFNNKTNYTNDGFSEMQQWLSEGWADLGCTAVVTQNDSTAIGVIKALREAGFRVPEDVSVTGYDNSGEDAHFDLKLTTVQVPLESIAQKAVWLLDHLLSHPAEDVGNTNLPTFLVHGESTAKCKGGNESRGKSTFSLLKTNV